MNANEWIKRHREQRKAAGLCIECGKKSDRVRCEECRQKNSDTQKRAQARKRRKGLCITCGGPREDGQRQCNECRQMQRVASKKCYGKKAANGLCVFCGKPSTQGRRACDECNAKKNAKERQRRARYTAEGRCRQCGAEAQLSNRSLRGKERGNYCKDCWLKVLAHYVLGSRKHWRVLVEKLDACGWRCSYTGETLVLGDNLSFDHMDPVCRFPEKRHDPDNVEPVSWQVNLMKRDLTKQEFLNLIERIYLKSR